MSIEKIAPPNPFHAEVLSRFGVLPNFFRTAASAPGLIEELWGFAKSAYLDCPLPSIFKERLFVHLSRFCEIRYCIVRHVGFLVGQGRPAGDPTAVAESVAQAVALLSRPVADSNQMKISLSLLEGLPQPVDIPESGAELEGALFDALTILFVDPRDTGRVRRAVTHAVGEQTFEVLVAFLAFVRTAHYWTETHPALGYESDMTDFMEANPQLARLMLDASEAEWAHGRQALRRAMDDLRSATGALRSSEERFRALVMATFDMVYRMSPDWTEMRSLDGRGFLADTTNPDPDWLPRYIPDDDRLMVLEALRNAVAAKGVFELEHRIVRLNGSIGWVLSRAIPIFNEAGEIIEWLGAALDLTARRAAEEALREADRRKDEFLATLAHELRNPLAPLRNGLQIARLSTLPDAPFGRTVEMMERQVNLLVHLVDDLLDVSRINTGKIQMRLQRVSLQDAVSAGVEATRASIDARRHRLVVDACSEKLVVEADSDRLTQVFSNLLSNAAKYTEPGGIIELRLRRDGDAALVTVSDSGIGISKMDIAGIFDIFSQVRSHSTRADGGLGIGLSLVRQLVTMHGGAVEAASPGTGQGSTFSVRLPLSASGVDIPTCDAVRNGNPKLASHRILVIDDNADAAASLAILLQQMGHDVATAANGLDGLNTAAAWVPDFVFLDLGMPHMDGVETARRLRAFPGGKRMILIALTGWGSARDREETRDAGFDYHLLKPVQPRALEELVSRRIH